MEFLFSVSGMRCGACAEKVSKVLESIPGIDSVDVTVSPPVARIRAHSEIPLSQMNAALAPVGSYVLTTYDGDGGVGADVGRGGTSAEESLRPLYVIVSYILAGVVLRGVISNDFRIATLMENFMGGFFVVFSLFKMIDLRGFADGYATYDLLARRSRGYALIYPFLELALGVLYFASIASLLTNVITVGLMGFGALGVWQALMSGQKIRCACLGTALKLPMTKVTLVEDLGMGAMALAMLFLHV